MMNIAIYNQKKDIIKQIKKAILEAGLGQDIVFHKYNSKKELMDAIKDGLEPDIVFSAAVAEIKQRDYTLLCHNGKNKYKINRSEIMYISIAKRGTDIFINKQLQKKIHLEKLHCNEKIGELYQILKEYNFVYAHNSYIVNMDYIVSRKREEIQLVDGKILSVSRSKTKQLKEKIENYREKNKRKNDKK